MDPIDRHTDVVHWRAQETDSGQSSRLGALESTKNKLRPTGRHTDTVPTSTENKFGPHSIRNGALESTYQTGPYRQTHRRGALAST